MRDFLEEKHLFNNNSHNRNPWINLKQAKEINNGNATLQHQPVGADGGAGTVETPVDWQVSPNQMMTTEVTEKSYRRLGMTKTQRQRKAYSKQHL